MNGTQIARMNTQASLCELRRASDYADMSPEAVHALLAPIWSYCPGAESIKTWSRRLTREAVMWAKDESDLKPEYFRIWERQK